MKTILLSPDNPRGGFAIEYYSGSRGMETPRTLILGGVKHDIHQVLRRKKIFFLESEETAEQFECMIQGEKIIITSFESGKVRLDLPDNTQLI